MVAEESGLSPLQQDVVLALVDHRTVMAAAKAAGVSRSTVYNWLEKEPEFRRAVGQARAQVFEAGLDTINAAFEKAVRKLEDCLEHGSSSIRLKAAVAICRLGMELRRDYEREGQIKELEERAAHLLKARPRT